MKTRRLVLFPLLCLAAARAGADPRWWWSDAAASTTGSPSTVDIVAVPPVYRGDPPAVFVAWVHPPQMFEGSLYVGASFDGGCSFCYHHVTNLFRPQPEVALAVTPRLERGFYVVQVLFADGYPRVAYDAATIPLAGTPEEKCRALEGMQPTIRELGQREASAPDLAVAQDGTLPPHFHAAWLESDGTGGWELEYARDLAGDGSAWEVRGLPTSSGELGYPRVSADLLHAGPAGSSAVNLAFLDRSRGSVLYWRSTDSGATFSATGEPPSGQPAVLNDPSTGRAEGPLAFDTPFQGYSASLWHGCLWYETRSSELQLLFDAELQSGPTTASPPWLEPDLLVDRAGLEQEGDPALALFPMGDSPRAPAFLFWTDSRGGPYEIFHRGGVLDPGAVPSVDLDRFPFPAARPTDPAVSTGLQLTGCAWEAATGGCLPSRTQGKAIRAAADVAFGDVFVAWIDDRSRTPQVWFKRTDRTVAAPAPTLAASCPTPGTRRVTVTWPQLPTCRSLPPVPERLARYFVYYGLDPGGPYLNTDLDGSNPTVPDTIVVADGPGLPDPLAADIDGLLAGTTYFVAVVPEDEARNLFPADFDPLADRPTSPANEASITTPVTCETRCLHRKTAATATIAGMFTDPDPTTGISFTPPERTATYGPCPFPPGEADPEAVLQPAAPALACYQLEGLGLRSLSVIKDLGVQTVRIGY